MTGLLPSGLPEIVADDEDLARVLRSSGHYSSSAVKPSAFIPPSDGPTSVMRHGAEPRDGLWELAAATLGREATIHGVAICRAAVPRQEGLDVLADEPPPRHANLAGWPADADPELRKAKRKEIAVAIASRSLLVKKNGV